MPISNFDPQEFSKNLAQQANEVVPEDLSDDQKKYVVNKVYQFCSLAGNALIQDTSLSFSCEQASVICQFIGEWTFHKSIDLIRGNVPCEYWDTVLQQVAFAIFETAKHTQSNNMDQQQSAMLIEQQVTSSYEKSIRELAQSGNLSAEQVNEVLSQSNIDQMAQDPAAMSVSKEEEEKALKLASIALFLNTLPEEKIKKILSNMSEEEAHQIQNYMQIPNLEQKLDPTIANEFLTNLKSRLISMPKTSYSTDNNVRIIKSLTTNYKTTQIARTVNSERSKIKNFIDSCINLNSSQETVISPHVSKIIASYVKQKLSVSY